MVCLPLANSALSTTLKWPVPQRGILSKIFNKELERATTLEKSMHKMSKCVWCYENAFQYQQSFPIKPFYQPQPVLVVDRCALNRQVYIKCTC